MYITNDPKVALIAEKYGVDRVWVDLETLGKAERQPGNTVKSDHSIEDIRVIKPLLKTAEMFVRINPWNESSKAEIDAVIDAGADIVMLPMWKTAAEVENFIKAVAGRAKTIPLLETKEAQACIDEVLMLDDIDEMYIGLNDLHLSHGMTFMFELLADGTVEMLCKKIQKAGIPYGFGGIARPGSGELPAERVLAEHYRLGSSMVILSRSFCNTSIVTDEAEIDKTFKESIKSLRDYEKKVAAFSAEDFENNRSEVVRCVEKIVEKLRCK